MHPNVDTRVTKPSHQMSPATRHSHSPVQRPGESESGAELDHR
jgi:hypothetical protein